MMSSPAFIKLVLNIPVFGRHQHLGPERTGKCRQLMSFSGEYLVASDKKRTSSLGERKKYRPVHQRIAQFLFNWFAIPLISSAYFLSSAYRRATLTRGLRCAWVFAGSLFCLYEGLLLRRGMPCLFSFLYDQLAFAGQGTLLPYSYRFHADLKDLAMVALAVSAGLTFISVHHWIQNAEAHGTRKEV